MVFHHHHLHYQLLAHHLDRKVDFLTNQLQYHRLQQFSRHRRFALFPLHLWYVHYLRYHYHYYYFHRLHHHHHHHHHHHYLLILQNLDFYVLLPILIALQSRVSF
uniref:Uncharacterized protein n=1 Tax=Glossina brevipalpis TaxID=37001 RepID=A0A1A9W636_9MUSC